LIADFDHVALIQGGHPAGHSAFASPHPGTAPVRTMAMEYSSQILWSDHCVQGRPGADFHSDLVWNKAEPVIRREFTPAIAS